MMILHHKKWHARCPPPLISKCPFAAVHAQPTYTHQSACKRASCLPRPSSKGCANGCCSSTLRRIVLRTANHCLPPAGRQAGLPTAWPESLKPACQFEKDRNVGLRRGPRPSVGRALSYKTPAPIARAE
eukprot:358192-Chlamydomonas_euryale.AAC.4